MPTTPKPRRNLALEKAILAAPDEPAPYLVYADWLTGQGDPRGELIVVQHAISTAKKPAKKLLTREKELLREIGRPGPKVVTLGWKWGFIDWVKLEDAGMDSTPKGILELAEEVFALPAAIVLREVRIGSIDWVDNQKQPPLILAALAKSPVGKRVKRVTVFSETDGVYGRQSSLQVLSKLPALESLIIVDESGEEVASVSFEFGKALMPKLRELVVDGCELTRKTAKSLSASRWPALEHLDVALGDVYDHKSVKLADLAPLLTGKAMPKLKHLGLRVAPFANKLPALLAKAPVLKTLESLALSHGHLDSEGVKALIDNAAAFAHLKELDVSESYLTKADRKALGALKCKVTFGKQRDRAAEERAQAEAAMDDHHHYDSVSE